MDTPSTGSHRPSRALARSSAAGASAEAPGTAAFDRGVLIADLPTRVVVTDPAMVPDVAEYFGPMADAAGPFDVEVRFQAEAPTLPSRRPDEAYVGMALWRDGADLVVDSGGPTRARVSGALAVVGGIPADPGIRPILIRRTLHHVIAHLLSLRGRLVVHGAAIGRDLAAPGEAGMRPRALLLLGGSGSGKSTSAYLASRAGWSLLSDDLVVARRHPGDGGALERVGAVGVHRALAVPGDIAGPDAVPIPRDPRGRCRPALIPDAREHDIAAVVLIRHGEGDGGVEPVAGMVVATAVTGSVPAAGNLAVAGETVLTAGVLAALPCFRLWTPATAPRRLVCMAALFEEIAREAGVT